MPHSREIIFYHYPASPYARRVVWYLNLRGIPYSQCIQPMIMPRPDVAAIGTAYRRIPIMAIGRDLYNDTRLILRKLEELYPGARQISASSPEQKAFERLFEHWVVDNGVFMRGAQLIPSDSPAMKDEKFTKDRAELSGRSWSKKDIDKMRPEALVEMRSAFSFLETSIMADGRDWILNTSSPSLADIEAIWPLHWVTSMPGGLPPDYISASQFPKVFAWIARFKAVVKAAAAKPKTLTGAEAVQQISQSEYAESECSVDASDPLLLQLGDEVEVWPIDSGFNSKDRGILVGLNGVEIVMESKTSGGKVVRIHCPRHGFRVRRTGKAGVRGSL